MPTTDFILERCQAMRQYSIALKRQIGDIQKSIRFGIFTRKLPDTEQRQING
jgi:hypothetical protein